MDFKPVVTISWELLFQIINTVILFLVLKKLLFKPVLNIIEKRENMIQDDLATGAKAKNEGIALKKEYEEKVSLAKEEGKEIIKQATSRAKLTFSSYSFFKAIPSFLAFAPVAKSS